MFIQLHTISSERFRKSRMKVKKSGKKNIEVDERTQIRDLIYTLGLPVLSIRKQNWKKRYEARKKPIHR
jgi:hypothetical protein